MARAVAATRTPALAGAVPYLYIVARVGDTPVVVAGTHLEDAQRIEPTWKLTGNAPGLAIVGRNVARQLNLAPGSQTQLKYLERSVPLTVGAILDSGAAEDNQVFVDLAMAQQLANSAGQIQVEQLRVEGNPSVVAGVCGAAGGFASELRYG